MEPVKKAARPHTARTCALVFVLAVCMNCFGFPVYNWNKEWPFSITVIKALSTPAFAVFTGGSLAALFPKKRMGFIVFLASALMCAGLACRFLLEFGEVSNTYNFTLPNIVLHMAVFVGGSSLFWLNTVKQNRH